VEPHENEASVGKELWGTLLGGNAAAEVDENTLDEEGGSGERGEEDEDVDREDEGSTSEWYVGAAEV
jgi:hypothetical protein